MSPPKWAPATKWVIFIICLLLVAFAIARFSIVLAPLVVAVIFAYLLNPIVNYLEANTPLKRGLAAAIVYILFLVILALIPSLLAPLLVRQIRDLNVDGAGLADQLTEAMDYQIALGVTSFNLSLLIEPLTGSLDQILSPMATVAAGLAVNIAGGFIWAIFIFVVGYYLLVDANRFSAWVDSWIPPDYFEEFKLLRRELDGVWKAYFIGQLTLALIVGVVIGGVAALLGIKSALLLGIFAALLELIPNWGYGLSGIVGVIFAYLQGSTYIPLPPWAFALLVAGFYFVMWQIDTNYLVPRIIGNRLRLPPVVIIVGIIAGASVGGAIGLLLAAPTIASVRVLGSYLYRRLLDLEPYVLLNRARPLPEDESLIDEILDITTPVEDDVAEDQSSP
jgi:predicted PurR-regulated permease PerM